MSFKLTHPLPEKCMVAVSGGVDSVTALHWLNRIEGRVQGVVHMNHNTGDYADSAEQTVRHLADKLSIPIFVRRLERSPEEGHSPENWWREQRYRWFTEVSAVEGNLPIVVAHNMDDCLEEYVMCTMVRGFSGTIPYAHGPCIRPFRLWKRVEIENFAIANKITWNEDPTNKDIYRFKRAFIRHELVPKVKELNPGVYKIVERMIGIQDMRDAHPDPFPGRSIP